MKRVLGSFLVVLTLLPQIASAAYADNDVRFDSTQPSAPGKGKVVATGSYKVRTGYSISSITLIVTNSKGDAGGEIACTLDENTKRDWDGCIAGLPSGEYTVIARATFKKCGSPDVIIETPS